jgi:hypothetical protein
MCRLARIAAMIPSTFFRLSSIPEHRGKTSRNGCVGLPARVYHFRFLFACNQKPPNLGGLDDGSSGAGIRTLGCSKNRWEDFDEEGSRKYGAVERDAVLFGILRSEGLSGTVQPQPAMAWGC